MFYSETHTGAHSRAQLTQMQTHTDTVLNRGDRLLDRSGGQVMGQVLVKLVCSSVFAHSVATGVCMLGQSSHTQTHSHSGILLPDSKTNDGDRCTHNFYLQNCECV